MVRFPLNATNFIGQKSIFEIFLHHTIYTFYREWENIVNIHTFPLEWIPKENETLCKTKDTPYSSITSKSFNIAIHRA